MSCVQMTPQVLKDLNSETTQSAFVAYTGWIPAIGVNDIRFTVIRDDVTVSGGLTGEYTFRPAIQTCAVRTSKPGAWTALGSALEGPGQDTVDADVETTLEDRYFFRLGVQHQLSGDRTFGRGSVALQGTFIQCGSVIGSKSYQVCVMSNATPCYQPITDWVPAMVAVLSAFWSDEPPTYVRRDEYEYDSGFVLGAPVNGSRRTWFHGLMGERT